MHRLKKVTSSFLFFARLSVCVCVWLWVSLAFLGSLGLHASWCRCWWKLLFGKIRISDGGIKKKSEQKAKKRGCVTLRSTSAAICEIDHECDLYIAEVERNIFESSDGLSKTVKMLSLKLSYCFLRKLLMYEFNHSLVGPSSLRIVNEYYDHRAKILRIGKKIFILSLHYLRFLVESYWRYTFNFWDFKVNYYM